MKKEAESRKTFSYFTISLFRFFAISLFIMMLHLQVSGAFLITPGPDETIKLVAAGIQAGNAAEVSKHFNTMVDLILPGYNDTYAKSQAGQILKEFFSRNPVKSFKVTKQGSSENGSQYAIGELQSGNKAYRVYFLIQTVTKQNLIQQLKIEDNNTTQP